MTLILDMQIFHHRRGLLILCLLMLQFIGTEASAVKPPSVCKTKVKIANTQGLQFGAFAVASAGTVSVSPSGIRSAGGGVVLVSSVVNAAAFDVTGCPEYTYGIILENSTTIKSQANTIVLDTFSSQPANTGLLDLTGYQQIHVGGVLHVNTGQATGAYSGKFVVEVIYN